MAPRLWPMRRGVIVTDTFRPPDRPDHWGIDLGWAGGSAGMPVFAAQGGTVTAAGPASGFGWWVLVDHGPADGSGLTVYGHIIPEVQAGQRVEAGERIARINPDSATNGGVPPHCHFEVHRYQWAYPGPDRLDPLPWLDGCGYPDDPGPVPEDTAVADAPVWAAIDAQQRGPRP